MSHTEFSLPLLKIIHCKCIIAHTLKKHITPESAKGQLEATLWIPILLKNQLIVNMVYLESMFSKIIHSLCLLKCEGLLTTWMI